ncbi:COG1712 Predicted dinucleotide-utilizing enzyme [Burkholderiaceae bacterium]
MKARLVIIGYGAIAAELIGRLREKYGPDCEVAVLLRADSPSRSKLPSGVASLTSLDEVQQFKPDLVVEAAGHHAVHQYAHACLLAGLSFVAVSVGAMADEAFFNQLCQAAEQGGAKLIFPSGAIGALDYIRAVRDLPDTKVVYESRKPPSAWADELQRLGIAQPLTEDVVLFDGHAREAALRYPQNLNVAASLALAGTGFERTLVRIVVDPQAKGNTHLVHATGAFGEMHADITNRPSPDNPKTSWVVGLSLLATVERHFAPVVFG